MGFIQSWCTVGVLGCVSNLLLSLDYPLCLCPCSSWTKPPQMPYICHDPWQKLRMQPGGDVKGESLCEERKRTKGSLEMCIWPTPGAARAAGWLHCRPSGTSQKHCDVLSTSSGSDCSSPSSVSPSPSSVTYTCNTHNQINMSVNKRWLHENVLIYMGFFTSLLISHCRLYMQSNFLLRQRWAARRFLLRRLISWTNSSCSRVKTCCFSNCWKSFLLRSTIQSTEKGNWTWRHPKRE